jgi:hypothetical protein
VLSACEHGIDLRGQLRASSGALLAVSQQRPAQLIVRATMANGDEFWTLPLPVCTSTNHDRAFSLRSFSFGCAAPGPAKVTAWLYTTDEPVDCAREAETRVSGAILYRDNPRPAQCNGVGAGCPPPPPQVLAYGSKDTENDVAWGLLACRNGTVSFDIALVPR